MKAKTEVKKVVSKAEAARQLREIADQVEAGQIKIGEVMVLWPESFECKLEYKVKDRKKQVEIEFEWNE